MDNQLAILNPEFSDTTALETKPQWNALRFITIDWLPREMRF